MTGLLVVTFVVSGIHTLLWLPRALQMRRARQKREQERQAHENDPSTETADGEHGSAKE